MALMSRLAPISIEVQKTNSVKWKLIKIKGSFGHTEDFIEFDDQIIDYIKMYYDCKDYANLSLPEFIDSVNA